MAESLETRFQDLIERTGALQIGHFILASGLHSRRFFRCIKLLEDPLAADFLFDAMAEQFSGPIDVVLGANEAGSILAFETAKRLKTTVAIARQTDHKYHLIDGFTLTPQQQVLIVDDITTTGGTAKQLIKIVQAAGAVPISVGLIATKGLFEVDLACPTKVLLTLTGMDAIAPENCPLCQQGIPLST
ncbi:MAG: orotate phosphoribosyltransferase [Cyanobacteria bacterium P01_D01_bin.44]